MSSFYSTWNTMSANEAQHQVTLPLESSGTYNFTVHWGDGHSDHISTHNDAAVTHEYLSAGEYTLNIYGQIEGWRFNNGGDKEKIRNISAWGDLALSNTGRAFHGCVNLTCNATDSPNLSSTANLQATFKNCESLEGGVSGWDVSNIENFYGMFGGCAVFNGDVSSWDMSASTNMYIMFYECAAFNQDIGGWNTANTMNMRSMFGSCTLFNQDISDWDTSNVTSMVGMFNACDVFNQDIGGWDTSSTVNMRAMFQNCTNFDQDLSEWNVEATINADIMMKGIELSTANYDALLISWSAQTVVNGIDFGGGDSMYTPAAVAARAVLTGPVNNWAITDGGLQQPFTSVWTSNNFGSSEDNQISLPLDSDGNYKFTVNWGDASEDMITTWDDPNLTHTYCSEGTYTVNIQGRMEGFRGNNWGDRLKLVDISNWGMFHISKPQTFAACELMTCTATDVPTVEPDSDALNGTFWKCPLFNGDLSDLDLNGAWDISNMFRECPTLLTHDFSNWDISSVTVADGFLKGSHLDTLSYTNLLIGWEEGTHEEDVIFHGGDSTYLNIAAEARDDFLIGNDSWEITDGDRVPFVTTWNTEKSGTSNNQQITLPLVYDGTYNFTVNWGDGSEDTITVWTDDATTHTYPAPGNYTVSIRGIIEGWDFGYSGDNLKLSNIQDWGELKSTGRYAFAGCENMTCDAPTEFNDFDTSGITNYSHMFAGCSSFNGDITGWDMAHVINMDSMFESAPAFNQDIGDWATSNATDMSHLFNGATAFNRDIGGWDTANVVSMSHMFRDAIAFDQDIGGWDVSNTTTMYYMFNMYDNSNPAFNQDLGDWDTANVTDMSTMFGGCVAFNQDLGDWDTANVTIMGSMFRFASAFDQDLGSWDIGEVTNAAYMFDCAALSTTNYNALLIGWAAQSVQSGVGFHAGSTTKYSPGPATTARGVLTDTPNEWAITDGGQA